MQSSLEKIRADYELVMQRIRSIHIKCFPGYDKPVFLISNAYPGVWMEHVYDAIRWAELEPEMAAVAAAQVKLFLDAQKEDGQFPCYVLDSSNPSTKNYGNLVGYGQLQECVSFSRLCLEASKLNKDKALLEEAYERCSRWDNWLVNNRMTMNTGLIELFCLFDTGHDNSARLEGIPGGCPDNDASKCNDVDFFPLLCPDLNAVFYGSRMALSEMAELLRKAEEAEVWRNKAIAVKKALNEHCYCSEDAFYYDADRNGQLRKFRSIHIANLFQEHMLTQAEADLIYEKHMRNPEEFWTPYPFPSMAINDPASKQDRPGNSWGFYSQGLTALRTLRWMDYYGKSEDQDELLRRWVDALAASDEKRFCQELHPLTGESSKCSQWYSSAMLLFVSGCRRLGYV